MKILQLCAGGLWAPALTKEFQRLGHEVVLADCRDVPRALRISRAGEDPEEYFNGLDEIARGRGAVLVYPHNHDEVEAIAGKLLDLEAELRWHALVPPIGAFWSTHRKSTFYAVLEEIGENAPRWERVDERIYNFENTKEGWIIKPDTGCGSHGQVKVAYEHKNLIACEPLKGFEHTIDAVCNRGVVVDYSVRKRLKTSGGVCVEAEVVGHHEVIGDHLRKVVAAFSLHGPLAIQGFLHNDNATWTWSDCNHRFGGGVGLSIAAGWKGIENYCRLAEGKEPVASEVAKVTVRRWYREEVILEAADRNI